MDVSYDYKLGIEEIDNDPLCNIISWYQSISTNRIVLKTSQDSDYCLCKRTDGTWDKVDDNTAISKFIAAYIPLIIKYITENTKDDLSEPRKSTLELLSNIVGNIIANNKIQIAITYNQIRKLLYHITIKYNDNIITN